MKRIICISLALCLVVAGIVVTKEDNSSNVTQVVKYNHIQEQETTSNNEAPVIHGVTNQVMAQLTK